MQRSPIHHCNASSVLQPGVYVLYNVDKIKFSKVKHKLKSKHMLFLCTVKLVDFQHSSRSKE
jgi:hypothetical protein